MADLDLFERERLLELLHRLANRMEADEPDGPQEVLVVVGGSYMALLGVRRMTADVDSGGPLPPRLVAAAAAVAIDEELDAAWINDSASSFMPPGLVLEECEVVVDLPALRVVLPPADVIFLMKLQAARATDQPDLRALWHRTSFGTPERAVECFYEAYPHEEPDEHLVQHVADVVRWDPGAP